MPNRSSSETATVKAVDPEATLAVERLSKAYHSIAEAVRPVVVSVYSEKTFRMRDRDSLTQLGMGSGILLDHEGNILTNYHVVHNFDEIKVQFVDRRILHAKVVGKDARSDLAVIRVPSKGLQKIPLARFGDSESVKVGDVVLAVGAPFGLAETVTHGIISATGRMDVGISEYEDYLQTDSAINPGNSGGPLVNARGEIIGMNSAIASNSGQSGGVGFAIPSNVIKTVLPKVIKGESFARGELGIGIQNMNEELAAHFGTRDQKGVVISQVTIGSSADQAGLKVEDIITKYDGKPVENVRVLRNLVTRTLPGTKVAIEIVRKRKTLMMTAVIGGEGQVPFELSAIEKDGSSMTSPFGMKLETFSGDFAGVEITDVAEGSAASLAGLQPGDVIVQANHQNVKNLKEYLRFAGTSKKKPLLLLLKRDNISLFVSLEVE